MRSGQLGIGIGGARAGKFMVLQLVALERDARDVGATLAGVPELCEAVATDFAAAALSCTVGLGTGLLRALGSVPLPREAADFHPLEGGGHRMPATGGDVFLHLHGSRPDACFELATRLREALGARVRVLEEVDGFMYRDERDLTGFIDGTENPQDDARHAAALIGDEDASHAGGSYVLAMRFVHDLVKWRQKSTREQELIVGRTKAESIELSDEDKPRSAHIARVVIEENGEELEIVRHSMPYGGTHEAGLYFIAYCRTRSTFDKMLVRMLGNAGDDTPDALLEFTHAVSGAYFFAPGLSQLRALSR